MHSVQSKHRLPGLVLVNHQFAMPLDHARPNGDQLRVFAREVVAAEHENVHLPWLLYLQGGPGMESPRPVSNSGWLGRALQEYRVLLLDQRGTGRSSPVHTNTLERFATSQQKADYLKHFRADAIVKDAELIRHLLLGRDEPWSILGQSFGGFCAVRYLSAAPAGLREAFITGGLPSLHRPVDDVYRATYRRVLAQNERYYERYPEDEELVRDLVAHLAAHDVRLPCGDRLTPRRLQQLGIAFGASDGFEKVHYLLEQAFADGSVRRKVNYAFLRGVENALNYDTNPIFSLLHEAIYCQQDASRWSAERIRSEYEQFEAQPDQRVYFTGEMIYPWMFEEYGALQPLQETAELLAAFEEWPTLYDAASLQANRVPCAAAIYYDDMYVERAFSEETAGSIQGIQTWITNEYQHNGLRADGEKILGKLIDMVRGR